MATNILVTFGYLLVCGVAAILAIYLTTTK